MGLFYRAVASSFFACVVLAVVPAVAQPAGSEPKPAGDPKAAAAMQGPAKVVVPMTPSLGCDRIGTPEGLPNSQVRAFAQDALGFMWLGTQDGLARYDGIQIRAYRHDASDVTSLSAPTINALALDPSGKLWVGTESGLDLYDPQTDKFTRYGVKPAPPAPGQPAQTGGVAAIVRDRKDRMWFAMADGGIQLFEPATNSFKKYDKAPLDLGVIALDDDAAGNLWLGADVGLVRWNPDTNASKAYTLAAADTELAITSVRVTAKGQVWVGTEGDGVFTVDPATDKIVQNRHNPDDPAAISNDNVRAIFEDKAGTIWIGTFNGINRIDASGRLAIFHHDPNDPRSLLVPQVESIAQDRGGVMWLGGLTVGACKFDESRLAFGYHHTPTLTISFWDDPDGTLWVGTYAGLYKYDRKARRATVYRTLEGPDGAVSLDGVMVLAMHRDRAGILWLAIRGVGMVALDTKTDVARLYEIENPSGLIHDIAEDNAGLLWLATASAGLVRLDPVARTFTKVSLDALQSDALYGLYNDPVEKGKIWVGTAGGGLVQFDPATGAAKAFRHSPTDAKTLSTDDIVAVHRDGNTVWIATFGKGLNKLTLPSGEVQRFDTTNSKLSTDRLWGVLPGADGRIWLSTGAGLVQYDPKKDTFSTFRVGDGLQDDEFIQLVAHRTASGELLFGGLQGFNAFDPRTIKRDDYVPPVVLTAFKVGNQDVKLEQAIWTLPPLRVSYSDSFEIQFAALSYGAPKSNRYAYKLEGYDSDFIETDRPFATYNKVDGGSYTLRVRAANRHGVWNETGLELDLRVTPAPWKTWWAYTSYVTFALLIGGAYVIRQKRKIVALQKAHRLSELEREMDLVSAVQHGFLPTTPSISDRNLHLEGYYRPAAQCSGDWWWYEQRGPHRYLILVGDVTGHGSGPAMVTAAVAACFRAVAPKIPDAEACLHEMNQEVLRAGRGQLHMTMTAVEVDVASGEFTIWSAGGLPIFTLPPGGRTKLLAIPGTPLGSVDFELGKFDGVLVAGERMMVLTDGLVEIETAGGKLLGSRQIGKFFADTAQQGLRPALEGLVNRVETLMIGPQPDDWTAVILQWGSGVESTVVVPGSLPESTVTVMSGR